MDGRMNKIVDIGLKIAITIQIFNNIITDMYKNKKSKL